MAKVVIVGAKGRMGQALVRLAPESGCEVVGQVDQGDKLDGVISKADAVIEFAHHAVSVETASLCASGGKPLVLGTTGHSEAEKKSILDAAKKIAVVWAP